MLSIISTVRGFRLGENAAFIKAVNIHEKIFQDLSFGPPLHDNILVL